MVSAFLRGLGKAPTFLVPIINPPFADNSPHFSAQGISYKKYHGGVVCETDAAAPGRAERARGIRRQDGRTIRPAVSLMILNAAAAVIEDGSREGLSSTTSRPTMRPLRAWMIWTACRVVRPPGS